MPDEKDLSETSGAARKRRKRELAKLDAPGEDTGKWALEFKRAGKPDLENPETGLLYTRKLQLIAAMQMATTPFPSAAQRECWKRIDAMSKAIGMTHSRSALENTIAKLRKQLDDRLAAGGTVVEEAGSDVPKPLTARGAPRGPRAVPLSATTDVPDAGRRPD